MIALLRKYNINIFEIIVALLLGFVFAPLLTTLMIENVILRLDI